MHLQIIDSNAQLGDVMRDFIRQRAEVALDKYRHHIYWVLLRLEDLKGSEESLDKRCQIDVHVHPSMTLLAHCTDRDWLVAVGCAAETIARRIERNLRSDTPAPLGDPPASDEADPTTPPGTPASSGHAGRP